MKIKYKTFIIAATSIIVIIFLTYLIFHISYFGYVNKNQEQQIQKSFDVINYMLQKEESNLSNTLIDWAHWDDTYQFINNLNTPYINSNLKYNTLEALNLRMMLFLNTHGEIIYSVDSNLPANTIYAIAEKLVFNQTNRNRLTSSIPKIGDVKTGLLLIDSTTFLVGITSITTSNQMAPPNGFLLMLREIDESLLHYIQNVTGVTLAFDSHTLEYFRGYEKSTTLRTAISEHRYMPYLEAKHIINDINGEDRILLSITQTSISPENTLYHFRLFIICFLLIIIVIGLLNLFIIHKYILRRILKLNDFMNTVAATKDTSLCISIAGNDELHTLAESTNKMLYQLDCAYKDIKFLSYTDKLTGLKNRAYVEEQLEVLDSNYDSTYFIIMGDLNGLKLINDTLGHKEGDRLLQCVSTILKRACSDNDIISRWAGDEFIILVKNRDKHYVSSLISKIKTRCQNVSDFPFSISIALGYAEKTSDHSDTGSVMNLAEKRMYRNKLMENKSARNAAISSLSRSLHEKHSETEEHTMRIRNLGVKLGKRLQLSQDKLDELELLALLHDIGKIGIPDHILLKTDKLTDDEWHIMKTHTEIGYRIAQSTPELAHIANDILCHHERYDGSGYPNGLKGEEIPILSRLINIIDSFDVMTHKRVYKDAYSVEYAIEELKRCSGTQFDPLMVEQFIFLLEDMQYIQSPS